MNTAASHQRTGIDSGAATLWASAMIILALIIVQAGRIGAGNQAFADSATSIRDISVASVNDGSGHEIFAVLDGRSERVLLYSVQNQRSVELFMSEDLGQMFRQAAGASP